MLCGDLNGKERGDIFKCTGFPGGSAVKKQPVNAGDVKRCGVQPLGQEDPLEEEMETHSSILVWEIPWIEEPGELQSMHREESDTTYRLNKDNVYTWVTNFCCTAETNTTL